jgi:hypothetical protein
LKADFADSSTSSPQWAHFELSAVPIAKFTATNKQRTFMETKSELTKVIDKVTETADNVKGAASEFAHRAVAEAEQEKRILAGDTMTTDAKANSMLNEAKQTAQGDVEAMKRTERNKA